MKETEGSPEILRLLIYTDLFLIILHLIHAHTPYLPQRIFSIERDRSFAEVFQYVKEFWLVLLFCWLSLLKGNRAYIAWAPIFAYLLVDDSFQRHERLGGAVARHLGLRRTMNLGAKDLGELVVIAISGAICLLIVGTAYLLGKEKFRKSSRFIVLMLAVLAFFGVVLDVGHVMVGKGASLYGALGLLEDGGEMLVMSWICWYVLRLLMIDRRAIPGAVGGISP